MLLLTLAVLATASPDLQVPLGATPTCQEPDPSASWGRVRISRTRKPDSLVTSGDLAESLVASLSGTYTFIQVSRDLAKSIRVGRAQLRSKHFGNPLYVAELRIDSLRLIQSRAHSDPETALTLTLGVGDSGNVWLEDHAYASSDAGALYYLTHVTQRGDLRGHWYNNVPLNRPTPVGRLLDYAQGYFCLVRRLPESAPPN